jgi:hypothetical protein
MTVLYRGPRALVTLEVIATDDTGWRRLAIADLSRVHIVRSDPGGRPVLHRALGVSALVLALVTIPIVGIPAVVSAALIAVALIFDMLARPKPRTTWTLVARHAGRPSTLFTSTDQREFDQLCRAVQRALERR